MASGFSPPPEAKEQTLRKVFEKVSKDSFLYASYHSAAGFRDDFRLRAGKAP